MSIDARVETVYINEDGTGRLGLIDRPGKKPGDSGGNCGVSALHFEAAPEEVTALNGLDIWGGSTCIMLGDQLIANRDGYTRIEFVSRERFNAAVERYWRLQKEKASK